jgi:tetratricopeptide (TPR) repeat protein
VNLKLRFCTAFTAMGLFCLFAGQTHAQEMAGGALQNIGRNNLTTLDLIPPESGWQGLANVLDAISPRTDARLTPSASQITDHIERLLNQGANQEALERIERRQQQIDGQRGTDVQLMFQHARALAALGRDEEAIALYTKMTRLFPELPEPWNNFAVIYAASGKWDRADEVLQMALRANPGYAEALANQSDLQRMRASSVSPNGAKYDVPGSKANDDDVESISKKMK